MAIAIDGTGTITGISVGGLNDSIITSDELANGAVTAAKIGYAGAILQVVSTTKTDRFTTSSTSPVAITGLYATITPTSTSSKILVIASLFSGISGNNFGNDFYLYYNNGSTSSVISGATGDAAGSRLRTSGSLRPPNANQMESTAIHYLHSPAKNTEIYYQIYMSAESASYTSAVNSTGTDNNSAAYARTASTITLLEIAG